MSKTSTLERWKATEPVRLYLYGLLGPLLALLIVYGLLDAHTAAAWAAVGAVVLVPGVELARGAVTPTGRHRAP